MPSVIPTTAGPIAAPAIAVATCEPAITQKLCEIQIKAEARTVNNPDRITQVRLRRV
jgi:hypothetical protein